MSLPTLSHPSDVVQVLRQWESHQPGRVAARWQGRAITFGELDAESSRIAGAMQRAGVQRGQRVAVLARNHPAVITLWWAAMKLGAVLVPINYRLVGAEVDFILRDSSVQLAFASAEFAPMLLALRAGLENLREVVCIDAAAAGCALLEGWMQGAAPQPGVEVGAQDVALQIYSSGTTGKPKGVEIGYGNMVADLGRIGAHGLWTTRDTFLMCTPLCHMSGSFVTLRCLRFGVEMVLMEAFDAADALAMIEQHRITKLVVVPTMLHLLLEQQAKQKADLSSLQLLYYGAGAMPHELLLRALRELPPHTGFATSYGMTETGGGVTFLGPEEHRGPDALRLTRSCGRPDGADIKVVDEQGGELPTGEAGEILVRSAQVMVGYYGRPDATRETVREGWLHTGDAGYFDAQGYLYISDRIKDMLKSGGINVYPREIEDVLLAHPAVDEVAVIGVPDPVWNEVPKAIVVRRRGVEVSDADLIEFARERMAKYKVPRSVDFLDALPRTGSGKVLKRELRKPYWEGRERAV